MDRFFVWILHIAGWHRYTFEEQTVYSTHLELARKQLRNYHSPLIDTNDRSII
jgi:hypothetical protein